MDKIGIGLIGCGNMGMSLGTHCLNVPSARLVAVSDVDGEKAAQAGVAITVPEKAKCPVCGMFVAKYPKWAASLTRGDSEVFYFDGVKDLMKFGFDPQAYHGAGTIEASDTIHVTDFYTLGAIDARQAFYVVGSNIYGPMGNELIPFPTRDQAEVFLKDHSGDQVLTFTQITLELVRQLDQ